MGNCYFSGYVARYNDYLMRAPFEEEASTPLSQFAERFTSPCIRKWSQRVLAHVIAVTVFPIFVAIDLIYNCIRALIEAIMALDHQTRQNHLLEADRFGKKAEKCALGFVASPCGIVAADFVTRHFVPTPPPRPGILEAGGKFHYAWGTEVYPTEPEHVQQLVQQAIDGGRKVAIAGAHYSQSKNTLPVSNESININMSKLNKVEIHGDKTATVQAGATWKDVQDKANEFGLAVRVMQASNVFSVGGSIGSNCHGWDHQDGALINTIISMTVVDGEGNLREDVPVDDELCQAIIGGHGLFGVVVSVRLKLIENETLVAWGVPVEPDKYADFFYKEILSNDNHVMELYRLSLDPNKLLQSGVACTYSKTTEMHLEQPPSGPTQNLTGEPMGGTRLDRILMHTARTFPCSRKLYWDRESQNIQQEVVITRNEIMRPPIYAAFNSSRADAEWLQEYFVKRKDLGHFLKELGNILMENKVPVLNATVRFVKHDTKSKLAYARDEDRFAIVLFFNQSLAQEEIDRTRAWIRQVIDYLKDECDHGTFYLPYQQFATKEQFQACYPQWQEVLDLKRRYDPNSLFENGLYKQYLEPEAKDDDMEKVG